MDDERNLEVHEFDRGGYAEQLREFQRRLEDMRARGDSEDHDVCRIIGFYEMQIEKLQAFVAEEGA